MAERGINYLIPVSTIPSVKRFCATAKIATTGKVVIIDAHINKL